MITEKLKQIRTLVVRKPVFAGEPVYFEHDFVNPFDLDASFTLAVNSESLRYLIHLFLTLKLIEKTNRRN